MTSPQSLLRTSNLYLALAVVALAATLGIGWLKFNVLQAEEQAVTDNESRRGEMTDSLTKAETSYKTFAEQRAQRDADFSKLIAGILPMDENYTDLTRALDDFFAENDKPNNPILQSNLSFSKGELVVSTPGISALSFSMTIESTRDNFFKFLQFVNESGSLANGKRLMEINSINLSFVNGGEVVQDLTQKINFTVGMTAYYQTPKVAR
ncbi:MAG: hypothetical protein AAB606_00045 [Patescibacteria group bacterium]